MCSSISFQCTYSKININGSHWDFCKNCSDDIDYWLRTYVTRLLTFESLSVILFCLFFQTSKPELNNLRLPGWFTPSTTSILFLHHKHLDLVLSFCQVFFFSRYLRPPWKRHSRVARPLCTRHECTLSTPTRHPWRAPRVTLKFFPPSFPFSFFFFPFFPLNYCNNSAPPAPKKSFLGYGNAGWKTKCPSNPPMCFDVRENLDANPVNRATGHPSPVPC